MKPDIKKKWIEALRSGKYRQGIRVLRSKNDEYCCLGVLGDILGCEFREPIDYEDGCYEMEWMGHWNHGMFYDPEIARKEFGMNNQLQAFALMNDEGASFEEIADFIEENE